MALNRRGSAMRRDGRQPTTQLLQLERSHDDVVDDAPSPRGCTLSNVTTFVSVSELMSPGREQPGAGTPEPANWPAIHHSLPEPGMPRGSKLVPQAAPTPPLHATQCVTARVLPSPSLLAPRSMPVGASHPAPVGIGRLNRAKHLRRKLGPLLRGRVVPQPVALRQ